ncbi:MAG: hypothetical protein ACR2N4_00055 [Jatrophihabitans sp.]
MALTVGIDGASPEPPPTAVLAAVEVLTELDGALDVVLDADVDVDAALAGPVEAGAEPVVCSAASEVSVAACVLWPALAESVAVARD